MHTFGLVVFKGVCVGGYDILLDVRMSHRFGNLKNPISGF